MANSSVNIPIQTVMSDVTMHVHVTGMRWFKVQMWIGIGLIKLASLVMGMGVSIEKND